MDFDIGEILAIGLVFELEILGGDIADLTAVGDDIDFKCVFLVGEICFCDIDWDTAKALLDDLIMDSTGVRCDTGFALGVRKRAKYEGWYVAEDDAAKSIGE